MSSKLWLSHSNRSYEKGTYQTTRRLLSISVVSDINGTVTQYIEQPNNVVDQLWLRSGYIQSQFLAAFFDSLVGGIVKTLRNLQTSASNLVTQGIDNGFANSSCGTFNSEIRAAMTALDGNRANSGSKTTSSIAGPFCGRWTASKLVATRVVRYPIISW